MVVSILNVDTSAERRTEVFQTLASLAQLIRRENGCLSCDFCQAGEDDTAFVMIGEWGSRETFDDHLRSPAFGVLLGMTPLLRRPIEVRICTVVAREGMPAVRKARGQAVAR
jgi:quinol monooxygenase YgiN